MKAQPPVRRTLNHLVDELQRSGRYSFTADEALASWSGSESALWRACSRLEKQGRIVSPRRGFYAIVPLEYRSAGAPPPEWYIDALMRFQGGSYYVGLLTAAALHGAAHQQVQAFQVVTDRTLCDVYVGRAARHKAARILPAQEGA